MGKRKASIGTEDYEIGYAKPPKSSQFKKGTTGNSKGRPKGSKSIPGILTRIGQELIKVTINGKTRSITKLEAIFMQLSNKAASGDIRAMRVLLDTYRLHPEASEAGELNPQLQALVDAMNHGPVERGKFNED